MRVRIGSLRLVRTLAGAGLIGGACLDWQYFIIEAKYAGKPMYCCHR
jgi:hypothetical protein